MEKSLDLDSNLNKDEKIVEGESYPLKQDFLVSNYSHSIQDGQR